MQKFSVSLFILTCLIWQISYSQLLYPQKPKKDCYVPPYDPNVVIISPDVQKWMDEQLTKPAEKKTVEMNWDIRGRVKSSSDKSAQKELKVVDNKQKRLVRVSDMHIQEIDIENMHGRSEYNKETKSFNYSLNDKKLKQKDYEASMKKHWDKFDKQKKGKRNLRVPGVINSDSQGWTAYMTADEIVELTKNNKELAIDDYVEAIPEASIANILRTIELSTHAFPNNYTGAGVGVGVVEPNCRDINIPLYRPNNYTSKCSGTTNYHHSWVVNVVQHAAPDAHIFGFRTSSPYPNPDSYSPPLQVVTHSYGYTNVNNLYNSQDADMDDYIYKNRIPVFKSAGNNGDNITSPGKALNIITVGAVEANNWYANYSSKRNSEVGNEKPEAAMYSGIEMGIYSSNDIFNGTSASAPLLAGFMASLLDECTFCRRQPALIKASIISAEKIPIVNANTYDLDNSKYAKGINKFSTTNWWTGGAWWDGANSAFFNSNNEMEFIENNVNAGGRHKIVISWLSQGGYISDKKIIQQDIDLYVYQNGNLLGYSSSSYNPFESVNFIAPTGDPLRVVIRRYRNGGGRVILGYNINYNH